MTAREISFELPAEPETWSVVLVQVRDRNYAGTTPKYERRVFQRLPDIGPGAWHLAGRDVGSRSVSWPELIGLAGGRPILVLWEPS